MTRVGDWARARFQGATVREGGGAVEVVADVDPPPIEPSIPWVRCLRQTVTMTFEEVDAQGIGKATRTWVRQQPEGGV